MSGFSNATDGDFDRVFMKGTELVDRFVGNRLWMWGANYPGSIGDNTTADKSSPVQTVTGGTNWNSVACSYSVAAIKTDGTLWMWGGNAVGQLGDNTTTNKSSPVQTVTGGAGWKRVATSENHTAAIKTDGTLWRWGANSQGQLGDNTTTHKSSPVQTIAGGTNWLQVACGSSHSAAIKTDGTLWMCGYNGNGSLGDNTRSNKSSPVQTVTGGTNWLQVACGSSHSAAIKTDGTLWMWGENAVGQLGDNTSTKKSSPVQTIAGGTNWKQVACGGSHSAAIKTDGTLWLWGENNLGHLGDNTITKKSSPVQTVTGGTNWKQVAVGTAHSAAIKTDGTLWTWGNNTSGQLGTNTTAHKSSPVQTIAGGTDWYSTSCDRNVTAAIGA